MVPVSLDRWMATTDKRLQEINERLVRLEATTVKKNGELTNEIKLDEDRIARLETFRAQVYVILSLFLFLIPVIMLLFDHLVLDR